MITYFAVKRTFHAICNAIIVVLGSTGPMIGLYCINQVHHQLKKKIRIKTLQKKVQSLNIKNYCRKIKHLWKWESPEMEPSAYFAQYLC